MATEIVFQRSIAGSQQLSGQTSILGDLISPEYFEAAHTLAQRNADIVGFSTTPEDQGQIVELYNAVIADGRFIRDFTSNPQGVAANLGKPLSDSAAQAIMTAGQFQGAVFRGGGGQTELPIEVICVAVVVVLCARSPEGDQQIIVDASGQVKL